MIKTSHFLEKSTEGKFYTLAFESHILEMMGLIEDNGIETG